MAIYLVNWISSLSLIGNTTWIPNSESFLLPRLSFPKSHFLSRFFPCSQFLLLTSHHRLFCSKKIPATLWNTVANSVPRALEHIRHQSHSTCKCCWFIGAFRWWERGFILTLEQCWNFLKFPILPTSKSRRVPRVGFEELWKPIYLSINPKPRLFSNVPIFLLFSSLSHPIFGSARKVLKRSHWYPPGNPEWEKQSHFAWLAFVPSSYWRYTLPEINFHINIRIFFSSLFLQSFFLFREREVWYLGLRIDKTRRNRGKKNVPNNLLFTQSLLSGTSIHNLPSLKPVAGSMSPQILNANRWKLERMLLSWLC